MISNALLVAGVLLSSACRRFFSNLRFALFDIIFICALTEIFRGDT
jgi:hypothetical protein